MHFSTILLVITALISGNVQTDSNYYQKIYDYQNTHYLTITCAGDIMGHMPQIRSAYNTDTKNYCFEPWFDYLKNDISKADLAMVNLETTLTEKPSQYSGYPAFRSPIAFARSIKQVGFDIVSTANNHCLDNGLYGLRTTLNHLREEELLTVGTQLPDENATPLTIEKNGIKLGIIAATYGTNGIPIPSEAPHVVNITSHEFLDHQIAILKAKNVDGILCFMHWGYEYKNVPNDEQTALANYLAKQGVNWIIGSHPHAIQPDDWIDTDIGKTYVIYSLGNLVSNQRWRYSDMGLAVTLNITLLPDKNFETAVDYHPFWVDKYDDKGAVSYAVIPLIDTPNLTRLSVEDNVLMAQALDDFYKIFAKTVQR